MRLKLVLCLGIISLAVTTVFAVSTDFSGFKPSDQIKKKKVQGEFYRGVHEKPVHSTSPVDPGPVKTYRFTPALQGDTVEHDFLIKNPSDKPMTFKKVKSCCGVILTGYTPSIAPGETGKISIVIVTDKFGGKMVNGRIRADVEDPKQTDIAVDVALFVSKIASLSQFKIILKGSCREILEGSTLIVPEKDHPFNVQGIKAKKGLHFQYGYRDVDSQGKKGFLVKVKNSMKVPGVYRDTLFVRTDNPRRPEIRVRVEGHISE